MLVRLELAALRSRIKHSTTEPLSSQKLCVFSQIKDRKHIDQNFHSVAGVMLQGWDLGAEGFKNFRICHGAPSTAHSKLDFLCFSH